MASPELIINDRRRFHVTGERRMDTHPIPPMTDPLSLHWKQPRRSLICVDKTHALMSLETFLQLCEYSASNPSGVYVGKMWRCCDGKHDRAFIARGGVPTWYLVWYSTPEDPEFAKKFVNNNYRKILLWDANIEEQK